MLLTLAFSCGLLSGCGGTFDCGSDSDAAQYARSLSKERLEKLYADIAAHHADYDGPIGGWLFISNAYTGPAEFSDLSAVRVSPAETHILLKGCFDQFVYLHFMGIDGRGDGPSVVLSYPAPNTAYDTIEEVLWEG